MRLRRARHRAPASSDLAVNYLEPAAIEARALGHNYVGTEHVLLVILTRPSSPAVSVLRQLGQAPDGVRDRLLSELPAPPGPTIDPEALATLGIDLDLVRARIEETFGEGALEHAGGGCMGVCPRLKRALAFAADDAAGARVDDDHVLAGLLAVEDSVAAGVLTEAGVTLADVRRLLEK
jgi:ATP-dependent Clp protease ATP-binding subunit ClpA